MKRHPSLSPLPEAFLLPEELTGCPKETPILVGYSGGADSTALLHMLSQYRDLYGTPVYAAHVHHGIRGTEADRDEQFCRSFADSLGIPFFVHHADVPALAREWGESVETAARRVRYDFFDALMERESIPLLATAHNADDNLETILFHLIRGCGLGGMCGIPQARACPRGTLIRPLLGVSRREILAYCRDHGLSYVEDSTNRDTEYTRNKLRSSVLPVLREINGAAVENAVRVADTLREDHLCLESMAEMFLEELRRGDGLETEKINGAPAAIVHRALRRLYEEVSGGGSLHHAHILSLCQLAKTGTAHASISLPGGWEAVIEEDCLSFRPQEKAEQILPFRIPLSGERTVISQINCEIIMGRSQNEKNIYKKSILLSIDSATINGALYVRNRLPGDRILSGGMHRSVKKLLCDRRVPGALRSRLPILCDDGGILAVPGLMQRDGSRPPSSDSPSALTISICFYE